jgi:hypothetical protein
LIEATKTLSKQHDEMTKSLKSIKKQIALDSEGPQDDQEESETPDGSNASSKNEGGSSDEASSSGGGSGWDELK